MDSSLIMPFRNTINQAAYIEAKKDILGNKHICFWNKKSIKQKIDHCKNNKIKLALQDSSCAMKLFMDANKSLKNKEVRKSNAEEFTTSYQRTISILNTPQGKAMVERIRSVQNLQQKVINLKEAIGSFQEKIESNSHSKKIFSQEITQIKKQLTVRHSSSCNLEETINKMFESLMNSREKLHPNVAEGTSPKAMQPFENALNEISNDLEKLNQAYNKMEKDMSELAKNVENKPAEALEKALLYLYDNMDGCESTYKQDPTLAAEHIITTGTALLKRVSPQSRDYNVHENKALDKLIKNFSNYIPSEIKNTKGGKEFLGQLKQYCQKRAASFSKEIEDANKKIEGIEARIKEKQETGTSKNKFLNIAFSQKSTVNKLEQEINTLKEEICTIRDATAKKISGLKTTGKAPNRKFMELKNELEILNKVKQTINTTN